MIGPPFEIQEAVHLFHGDSSAGTARYGGWGRHLVVARDTLSWGPCDRDPVRHGKKRRAHWLAYDRLLLRTHPGLAPRIARETAQGRRRVEKEIFAAPELLKALAGHPLRRPIVLWTTPTWSDRLTLFWALDALHDLDIEKRAVWVAQPRWTSPRVPVSEASLGCFNPDQLQDAFALAQRLSGGMLEEGGALWRKYSWPSPLAFDEARRRGSQLFPELSQLAEVHGKHFPRVSGRSRRLRLSELDELFLSRFRPDRWLRPIDCLKRPLIRDAVFTTLATHGETFFTHRLRVWARERDPPLLQRDLPEGGHYHRVSYRLTPRGALLLERGLERPEEAPPLFTGGCLVYSGKRSWVRRDHRGAYRIERFGPPRAFR
jgi:hypothetical protein